MFLGDPSSPKKMVSHEQSTPFLLDTLFSDEEIIKNTGHCLIKGEGDEGDNFSYHSLNPEPYPSLDDEELSFLLRREKENELYNGFKENPLLAKDRDEAVQWMLKVIGYYSFSAITAYLAVNYLDRFLYRFQSLSSRENKPWMTQLAAVACLSLAAKVEEIEVPLLLDLQVEESKYVFESKTIQRMEILVLSTLEWKMNIITPISFLDYISRRLALKSPLCREFLRRCECLILSLISDCRFMSHLPSALATVTMLYVISSVEPCIGLKYQDKLVGILGINKEKVEECCRVIQEVASSVNFHSRSKRKFGSLPSSPKGLVDLSFNSDTSLSDSWEVASVASVSSSPEPLSKKVKSQNHAIL